MSLEEEKYKDVKVKSAINTASFDDRLKEFPSGFSEFLKAVWSVRNSFNLTDFHTGSRQIYNMYCLGIEDGTPDNKGACDIPFDDNVKAETLEFAQDLLNICGYGEDDDENDGIEKNSVWAISLQGGEDYGSKAGVRDLQNMSPGQRLGFAERMSRDFFHILRRPLDIKRTTSRIYINAKDVKARLIIMEYLVKVQFPENNNISEAKVAGPGNKLRADNMIVYLKNDQAADDLADILCKKFSASLKDELPILVEKRGPGIGRAGNPPRIQLHKDAGDGNSFGKLYSKLFWIALKTTLKDDGRDGKEGKDKEHSEYHPLHFLDNINYQMKLLKVNIKDPTTFPDVKTIERLSEKWVAKDERRQKKIDKEERNVAWKNKTAANAKSIQIHPVSGWGSRRSHKPLAPYSSSMSKHANRMTAIYRAEQDLLRVIKAEENLVQKREQIERKIEYLRQQQQQEQQTESRNKQGGMGHPYHPGINTYNGRRQKATSNTARGRRMIEEIQNEIRLANKRNDDQELSC